MNRTAHFIILLLLILSAPLRTTAQKAALDSVLHLLEKHPARDVGRLDLLNESIRRYEFIHPRRAVTLGDEATALARSLGDERRLVVALYRRVALDQAGGNMSDRSKELNEAIAIGRRLGLKSDLAWALLRKGLNDINQNGPDTNRTELVESARIFHALGDGEGEGAALNLQASDVRDTDTARAEALYQQAERLLKKSGQIEWLVRALQNQVYWHWMGNRFDKAIGIGERALSECTGTGYDVLIMGTHSLLGNANKEGGHYRASIEHFLIALRISEVLDLTENSAIACLNLGPMNLMIDDPAQATVFLQRGYELAKKSANPGLMTYALRGLGQIEMERGAYAKALQHFEEALSLCSNGTSSQANIDQCASSAYVSIGDARTGLEDILGAKAAYEAALAAAERSQLKWEMGVSRNCLCKALLRIPDSLLHEAGFARARSRDLRAVDIALRTVGPAREGGWASIRISTLTVLVEGYERLNDPANALL